MPTPAIEEHFQNCTNIGGFGARACLAAGLVVFCQYADMAAAQSNGSGLKAPLPVQAPAAGKRKTIEPPAPDVWSASEIADARRICTDALNSMSAKIEELAPIKKGPCGSPAPIRLISIGKTNPVTFKPAPTVSCRMLVPLKQWISRGLQPAAERHLDTRVKTVSVMSSYSCRTRYGRKGARMSEHAFANALDIGGFRLATDGRVSVLKDWGPTKRDIARAVAAAKAKKLKAEKLKTARSGATSAPVAPPEPPRVARRQSPSIANSTRVKPNLPEVRIDTRRAARRAEERRRQRRKEALHRSRQADQRRTAVAARERGPLDRPIRRPGPRAERRPYSGSIGGAFGVGTPVVSPPPLPVRRPLRRAVRSEFPSAPSVRSRRQLSPRTAPSAAGRFQPPYRLGGPKPAGKSTPRAAFLRSVHASACRIFGTTLGPEANEAHRNHFHVDMFPRKRRGYCE